MYDIIFLSYNELHAEEHWKLLEERFPRALRVSGVRGLLTAHQNAAMLSRTRYFWVVDADNIVKDDFDFSFHWPRRDTVTDRVAVWRAENSANGLEYGYGGVKLLPTQAVLDMEPPVTDFTTSISEHFHPMDEVASVTIIHSTPFEAWKAAFRECVKLSSGIIRESNTYEDDDRLNVWRSTVFDVPNHKYVIVGARQGAEYGTRHGNDPEALRKINDWRWLNERFREVAEC